MRFSGIRVQITGSSAQSAEYSQLDIAHKFVRDFAARLIEQGAGLVVGFGDEPVGGAGLPCTFDWTVLEQISESPTNGRGWPSVQSGRFRAIGSQRALERIPASRTSTWSKCRSRLDFELELSPPGWRMGGVIRESQVLRGDVLVAIGGGGGVEHLAELYLDEGKSVIPVRSDLGAFASDGNGGATYLHSQALRDVAAFFELLEGTGSATGRLSELKIAAETDPTDLAKQVGSLVNDLRPPRTFYTRLLAKESDAFESVEGFFRMVVDPIVLERGLSPYEVGRDQPSAAFLNTEIFVKLHRAQLVIADLTGVRPNCMMELGYALARRRRVIVSAQEGTVVPFNTDKLPIFFWSSEQPPESQRELFRTWVDTHMDLPPIVT